MPPLTTDQLAGEIGLIIERAIKAKARKLSVTGFKAKPEDIMEFLHEEDFEDMIFEASDKAADLISDRLCLFAKEHPAECQLCA